MGNKCVKGQMSIKLGFLPLVGYLVIYKEYFEITTHKSCPMKNNLNPDSIAIPLEAMDGAPWTAICVAGHLPWLVGHFGIDCTV